MRELNQQELNEISGGMDANAFNFLFQAAATLVGIGIVAAFAAGAGAVKLYDYFKAEKA